MKRDNLEIVKELLEKEINGLNEVEGNSIKKVDIEVELANAYYGIVKAMRMLEELKRGE